MPVSKSKTAVEVRKEFEGAVTESLANKTLNPRDAYNEGFNAGVDEAVKFVRRYIKGDGIFQL